MIDFSKAIRMDKIATMSAKELKQVQDLLTPKESKTALEQVKNAIANGENLFDMAMTTLMDAVEIKMNSVGHTHHGVDTVYYDLYQIAEKLVEYYAYDAVKKQVAETIYEIDYYCYYDDGDDE